MSTEVTDIEHVEVSAVTPNALEQMERANIDIQIATAKAYPRSLTKFYDRATAMVTLDEETAKSCLYRRPVGKDASGKMTYAEGESIRLAEIVAASYGNIRAAGIVAEMTDKYVKAVGMCHDLESNYAVRAEVVESVVGRNGQPFSERMRVVVAKAAQSKAIRDAIFRIVPKSVCKPLADKARIVAKGDAKTFETRRKAVVDWVKSLKIEAKRVWAAIGVNGPDDIQMDDLVTLAGIKTAIDDKDVTVAEAFPVEQSEQKQGTEALADRLSQGKQPPEPPTNAPPEEPKKKGRPKGTGKKKGKDEPKTEAKTEPPAEQEAPTNTPGPENKPKDKYKCLRCERTAPDTTDGGKCKFCFGDVTEIAG